MTRRQALLWPLTASAMLAKTADNTPAGYKQINLPLQGEQHPVFYTETKGPPIIILHELPGLTPDDLALGLRIADEGFTSYLPLIFGAPNEYKLYLNAWRACHGGQINCSAKDKESHCVTWLRPLCDDVSQRHAGGSVGVIGMCITGGLPIALLSQPCVKAVVLSQPSLPTGQSKSDKEALGVTEDDIKKAQQTKTPMLGLRFQTDTICPPERFVTLKTKFPDQFCSIEIPPQDGEPGRDAHFRHAVLTGSYDPSLPGHKAAYDRVIRLFKEHLG